VCRGARARAHTRAAGTLRAAMKGSVCTPPPHPLLRLLLVLPPLPRPVPRPPSTRPPMGSPARPAVFRHLRFAKRGEKVRLQQPRRGDRARLRGRASETAARDEIRVYARTINARAKFIARETGETRFSLLSPSYPPARLLTPRPLPHPPPPREFRWNWLFGAALPPDRARSLVSTFQGGGLSASGINRSTLTRKRQGGRNNCALPMETMKNAALAGYRTKRN